MSQNLHIEQFLSTIIRSYRNSSCVNKDQYAEQTFQTELIRYDAGNRT